MLWIPHILLIAFICTIALARPVPDDPEEDDAAVKGRSPCIFGLPNIFGKIMGGMGGGKGGGKGGGGGGGMGGGGGGEGGGGGGGGAGGGGGSKGKRRRG